MRLISSSAFLMVIVRCIRRAVMKDDKDQLVLPVGALLGLAELALAVGLALVEPHDAVLCLALADGERCVRAKGMVADAAVRRMSGSRG
ncbi:hypothetical protein V8E36_008387 [Tilletia maclaganii]